MKSKIVITETPAIPHHKRNFNTRIPNKFSVNKENHDGEEDFISIPQEPRSEKAKVEKEKVNKSKNIPTGNITELNKLIYAGVKLISDKIGISLKSLKRNTKPGWEIRLEKQVKKLR